MKKIKIAFLLLLICSAVWAQQPQNFKVLPPETAGFSAERLKNLDRYLQGLIDKGIAPNAVTFVARHGQIIHYKAFGFRNIEKHIPLQQDDIFRIASQTKAITTTALLILYEEGKCLLDDPISKYIPAFKDPQVLVSYDAKTLKYTTRPAKSQITIRQLLSHTSGIGYDHPLQELPEFKVPFFNSVENETLADVIPKLAKRPLSADPGEKFIYGLGVDVAGYLVEILSGQTLDQFIRERILNPLGMKDTYFYLPDSKASRLVELYSKAKADDPLTVHSNNTYRNFAVSGARKYYSGGAGLVSTALDYGKLLQMILNGGSFNGKRILSRKTVELMTRNQIRDAFVLDRQDKFGLGFEIISANSHYGDLASVNSLTWGGMYCSEYTIDPAEDMILLIMTNVQPFAYTADFEHKFKTLVYQALK